MSPIVENPSKVDNVEIIVNEDRYPLHFQSYLLRNEEVIPLKIKVSSLSLREDYNNTFTIVVLPFKEDFPIPPPYLNMDKRGPAHFRDIEIGKCMLELELE